MVRSQSGFSERSTLRTNIRPIPEDGEYIYTLFITAVVTIIGQTTVMIDSINVAGAQ